MNLENKKDNKYEKIGLIARILLCIVLMLSLIPINANAVQQISTSAEDFQKTYAKFSIEITFNATTLTGAPILKTIEKSVLISNKANAIGTEQDSIYAYTKAFYSITEQEFYKEALGLDTIVYPKTSFKGASFTNDGIKFTNTTFYNTSYYILMDNTTQGIGLVGLIPDPKSIASDYCRKNNLILGDIINITRKIDYKSTNVKDVFIGMTRPVKTDNNLDDGYTAEVETNDFGVTAAVFVGIAIGMGIMTLINVITKWLDGNKNEQNQKQNGNLTINVPTGNNTVSNLLNNHTNIVNIVFPDNESLTTAYEIYLELAGENATAEGFMQFIRYLYPNLTSPVIQYTTIINQSQSPSIRANQTQAATQVAIFSESVVQIIIVIIIIIVIVIAIVIIIKMIGGKKNYGGYGGITIVDTD
ncbi:MAG: hypothetical protein ACTSRP_07390 [Candidatus Helarchaeota archaeon]